MYTSTQTILYCLHSNAHNHNNEVKLNSREHNFNCVHYLTSSLLAGASGSVISLATSQVAADKESCQDNEDDESTQSSDNNVQAKEDGVSW